MACVPPPLLRSSKSLAQKREARRPPTLLFSGLPSLAAELKRRRPRTMPTRTRQKFDLRPHDPEGVWESNDGRYRTYAHQLLAEHVALCDEVLQKRPGDVGAAITNPNAYPEITALGRRRDQTADTVRIYAAMAVEGYLNFYGVLRLGNDVFAEYFERLGLVPKLRTLLLTCDQLNLPKSDPLVLALDRVARSRNALVHPKTREVVGDLSQHKRTATPAPETARSAVNNMEAFFEAFVQAVPQAANHLSRRGDA